MEESGGSRWFSPKEIRNGCSWYTVSASEKTMTIMATSRNGSVDNKETQIVGLKEES